MGQSFPSLTIHESVNEGRSSPRDYIATNLPIMLSFSVGIGSTLVFIIMGVVVFVMLVGVVVVTCLIYLCCRMVRNKQKLVYMA